MTYVAERTPQKKEQHLAEEARMYLEGKAQYQIAEVLDISPATVCRDMQELVLRWKVSAERDITERKAEELARLDKLEATAWEAWDRSCKTKTERGSKSRDGGIKGSFDEEWEKELARDGDPRFLATVYQCISKRIDILGIDAPKKSIISGPGGKPIQHEHTHQTETDRELQRLLAGADRAGQRVTPGAGEFLPEGFKPTS